MMSSRKYRARLFRLFETEREQRERRVIWVLIAIVTGIILGHLFLAPLDAYAATMPSTSLPYVDDANERIDNRHNVTIACAGFGRAYKLKVVDTKTRKRVKARHVKKRVWLTVLKNKRLYKISVRADGSKWKSIYYRIG